MFDGGWLARVTQPCSHSEVSKTRLSVALAASGWMEGCGNASESAPVHLWHHVARYSMR